MRTPDDLTLVRDRLVAVEPLADKLPWAKERPWRVRTHVGLGGDGVVTIDLHDLSVPSALEAVQRAIATPLASGGLVLVTGRGRHSGGVSKLRRAVHQALIERAEAGELAVAERGPGRLLIIWDHAAIARQSGLGWVVWLVFALLLGGLALTVWRALFGEG